MITLANPASVTCAHAALRDSLLPKLIRGEIRVKDAERFLKERGLRGTIPKSTTVAASASKGTLTPGRVPISSPFAPRIAPVCLAMWRMV